jgi:nitrogen fixation protein NifU and related proteins
VADLRELYQSVILDHSRSPRNFGPLADASGEGSGHNPMCGDAVTVWVRMEGDTIADVRFATPPGVGCAISKASASLMTAAVRGKTRQEAETLFASFHALVTDPHAADAPKQPALGSLVALGGVARFPIRVKCATLAWHALRSALGSS